jgi:XTP/dITP diphosphohydrolase
MKLFVATHNQHKIREISQILPEFEIVADDPEGVEENAPDFAGNALIKVHAIAERHPGEWCMADDSGLEVKALGGAPGVHSARYAGEPCNTPANNALLLKNLEGKTDRRARFTCCCALVDPSGEELVVHGHCPGHIAEKASGSEGFGYDPLFIPDGYDKSFADLSADEKNAISHRGRALEKVKAIVGSGEGGKVSNSSNPPLAHSSTLLAWLSLFRVVNLPTVPGDVLVGVGLMSFFSWRMPSPAQLCCAAAASVFLYMFGLVDNDIVGAKGDKGRPIPDGEISIGAARLARGLCLFAALIAASTGNLPRFWWPTALSLALSIVVYNRTKWSFLMGLCRALNVVCGVASVEIVATQDDERLAYPVAVVAGLWFLYIWAVTKYSEGEEKDPGKKRLVGMFVGGVVYLQLLVLIVITLVDASAMPLLVAGAVLLVVLRLMKRLLPRVSAS